MFFSIIIPVYNTGKYLSRCIDSVFQQTCKDYEIIIVDDGSDDYTKKICVDLANNFSSIKLFFQNHLGASAARNKGIKESSGKYIVFLDSDDMLENDSLIKIQEYLLLNHVDVLQTNAKKILLDGTTISNFGKNDIPEDKIYSGKEYLKYSLSHKHNSESCLYICSRNYLIQYKLLFMEGVIHEDVEFTLRMIYFANSVTYKNINHYIYIERNNSVTTGTNDNLSPFSFFKISKFALNYYSGETDCDLVYNLQNFWYEEYLIGCLEMYNEKIPAQYKIDFFEIVKSKIKLRKKFIIILCNINNIFGCKVCKLYHFIILSILR